MLGIRLRVSHNTSPEPVDCHRFGPAGHPGPCPFQGCGYTPRSSALNPVLNLWNHIIGNRHRDSFHNDLQLPSRQFQGRLSATSGTLVDGTIAALSFAVAPPLSQASATIAAMTSLSTSWIRTHPPGASPLPADAPPLPPVAELPTYEDICTTPAKVWYKHLNNRIMSRLSSAFADTLRACNAVPESNAGHQQVLMFFKCILWAPAGKLPRGANVVSIVRRRLDRWQEGLQLQLWSVARDEEAARGASNHTPAPVEQSYRVVPEGIERRAVNYARGGDLGRADKAFLPQRKAVASVSTLEELQQKHPDAPVPIVPPTRDDHDPPYLFKSETVQKEISQFDRGSAPGDSGLRPSHLQDMLRASSEQAKAAFLSELTVFVNRSFHGHLPELLVPWFVGAPLTAFVKNGGGVRPLAVGETPIRVTSKLGVSTVKDRAAMYIGPQDDPYVPVQLRVGVCGGAEIVVHLVRSVVEAHGGDDSFALWTFDFTNAFNEVSRQKIPDIVQEKYPELCPCVKMCYAKTSHLRWNGHRTMSACGVQQGDPLGPLLFFLVIYPVLTEVAKQVVAEFPDLAVEGVFKLFIFYLDGGYVIAKHAALIRLGELLAPHGVLLDDLPSPGISSSQDSASTTLFLVDTLACSIPRHLYNLTHDSGAHLKMAKSPAWWPAAPSADILQKYEAAGVPFLRTEGVLVLKVPVGSDTYLRTQLVNKVEELRTRMQVLGDSQDTQAALLILRVCMGVCRVNFPLRTLPQPLVKDAADVFDDLMQENFSFISCAVRPDRVWTATQLSISTPDCPGLGLTSDKSIMFAARLTSRNAARSVLSKFLPASLLQTFVSNPHLKSTSDDFRSRSDTSALSFSQLCSEVRHEQKSLVGDVHKKMAE
jgi:hypothetical protein